MTMPTTLPTLLFELAPLPPVGGSVPDGSVTPVGSVLLAGSVLLDGSVLLVVPIS